MLQRATEDIAYFEKQGLEVHFRCCKYMRYERVNEGEVVFRRGEKGEKFYIILQGRVSIEYENDVEVNQLSVGESFGELALLTMGPRSATVRCKDKCEFAVLGKDDFK